MNATESTANKADSLRLFIDSDRATHDAAYNAIKQLRRAFDRAAERLAKERADWHDDPQAEDHAEYHAPADEQFTRAARDLCIRQFVKWHLNEFNIQEGGAA